MKPLARPGAFPLPIRQFCSPSPILQKPSFRREYVVSEDNGQAPITPAWFDYKQAEAYSSLSRTTLWQLINARKIKAARVGRAVRIERESLQEFLERSSNQW